MKMSAGAPEAEMFCRKGDLMTNRSKIPAGSQRAKSIIKGDKKKMSGYKF